LKLKRYRYIYFINFGAEAQISVPYEGRPDLFYPYRFEKTRRLKCKISSRLDIGHFKAGEQFCPVSQVKL